MDFSQTNNKKRRVHFSFLLASFYYFNMHREFKLIWLRNWLQFSYLIPVVFTMSFHLKITDPIEAFSEFVIILIIVYFQWKYFWYNRAWCCPSRELNFQSVITFRTYLYKAVFVISQEILLYELGCITYGKITAPVIQSDRENIYSFSVLGWNIFGAFSPQTEFGINILKIYSHTKINFLRIRN